MNLKEHFIATVTEELEQLNGTSFEVLCKTLFEMIIKQEVEQKGHNLYLKPVKGVDLITSDNIGVIGQCGTDADYFTSSTAKVANSKPVKDIKGSIKNDPQCKVIYLFANKRQTSAEKVALMSYIDREFSSITIYIYDSERIADTIYNNIEHSNKIEILLQELPKSLEYYNILPKANQVPHFNGKFYERKEYDDVIKLLEHNDVVQIYGISGIGKTEFAKSIAINQSSDYETVIWIDGSNFNGNINYVPITRDAKIVNLEFILSVAKILVIIDNLNHSQSCFIRSFSQANKNNSKCIITTLVPDKKSGCLFSLPYFDYEQSMTLLTDGLNEEMMPEGAQVKFIIDKIHGYALLLKLIRTNIENKDLTWSDVVNNISDITSIEDDETHKKVACRLIGKYISDYGTEFRLINCINSTQISKCYFDSCTILFNRQDLQRRCILQQSSPYFYSVHQIILDSIRTLIPDNSDAKKDYLSLVNYLQYSLETKPIGFYDLIFRNRSFINNALDSSELEGEKKIIVYSILQCDDTFSNSEKYKTLIDKYLDSTSTDLYDILLYIEKNELELHEFTGDKERKSELALKYAKDLEDKLNTSLNKDVRARLLHHVGKLYVRAGKLKDAEKYFTKVLDEDSQKYYTLLQLGRLYNNLKQEQDLKNCVDRLFMIGEDNLSLSSLLSCYELLAPSQYDELRQKYIKDRKDIFESKLLYAISIDNNQVLGTLSKLCSYLQYNMPETFSLFMETVPLTVYCSHDKAINYARLRMTQYKSFTDKETEEALAVFNSSFKSFKCTPFEKDFERKLFSDLLLEAGKFQDVLDLEKEFENKHEPFYCMNRAKAFREIGQYEDALNNINISLRDDKQKNEFKASFHYCKATIFYRMKNAECTNEIEEAIRLQKDKASISRWQMELNDWNIIFKSKS